MAELKESTQPPRVSVSVGYTRNMGNFESLRLDIGIEDSARPGENAKAAFDRVYSFVETRLIEKINEIEKDVKDIT